MTDIAKLERAFIKAALRHYPVWVKRWGQPHPWGHVQCVRPKSSWYLIKAIQALYEAKQNKR